MSDHIPRSHRHDFSGLNPVHCRRSPSAAQRNPNYPSDAVPCCRQNATVVPETVAVAGAVADADADAMTTDVVADDCWPNVRPDRQPLVRTVHHVGRSCYHRPKRCHCRCAMTVVTVSVGPASFAFVATAAVAVDCSVQCHSRASGAK